MRGKKTYVKIPYLVKNNFVRIVAGATPLSVENGVTIGRFHLIISLERLSFSNLRVVGYIIFKLFSLLRFRFPFIFLLAVK